MSQPNLNEKIQVDTSDDDSLFDTQSLLDSSLSFASSVRDYNYENGRRYHAYRHGQYPFPNDQEEQDRLALIHHFHKLVIGGSLYRAPIQSSRPRRVLDIGTGTAEWALEMAEAYPEVEIIGFDLSPIQPAWAPPNCRFFIDDAESDWTFSPNEKFDYIHLRNMAGGLGDWRKLLKQAYQHLTPGGWFEAQEYEAAISSDDGTHEQATATTNWQQLLEQASSKFGKPINNVSARLPGWMEHAGFMNVTKDVYKCPIGGWPKDRRLKDIGRMCKLISVEAVEPLSLALFTRVLGISYPDAQDHIDQVRAELASNAFHLHSHLYYVYGQKPFDSTP